MDQKLVEKSHLIACVLHLREASHCIESEHESISLAILQLADSIASLYSVDEQQVEAMERIADEVREA